MDSARRNKYKINARYRNDVLHFTILPVIDQELCPSVVAGRNTGSYRFVRLGNTDFKGLKIHCPFDPPLRGLGKKKFG